MHRLWMFAAAHSVERADRSRRTIIEAAEFVARMPSIGRPGPVGETREWLILRLQYVLTYRVTEQEVIVVSVHHTKENRA